MREDRTATIEVQETLIVAVNAALEMEDWVQVLHLTTDLYRLAVRMGDVAFADLLQDLHWIANDALAHPLHVERLLAP